MSTHAAPWSRTAALLQSHCRPKTARNIGIEIERIGLWEDGYSLHYRHHPDGRPGAEQMLMALGQQLGWPVVTYSEASPLGLSGPQGKVSLEPGSQLEFSANPMASVRATAKIVAGFENEVEKVTSRYGLHWVGLGLNPFARVEDLDVIPLTRYRLMTDFFGRHGTLGTTMMRLTSSIQINFDYSNEIEAISMLRASLALAPLSTALFGNSPFSAGGKNGWKSFRSEVWRQMDPARSGLMPEAFEDGFNFENYAELAWKRPLMFVQNTEGRNVASADRTLQEIALGQLEGCELNDENEMTCLRQLFTEARLKPGYVEVRSIDGLRLADRYPCVAFWTGVIYSEAARNLALDRLGSLTPKLRNELWVAAGREGLHASIGGISMQSLALEMLEAARKSLVHRGLGEENYLVSLEQDIRQGKNPADKVLELYDGPAKQNLAAIVRYCAERSA
ncbi:hypothetical protein K2X33_11950 [bacterium]|nr:hypothetical protein [bacterium]